MEPASADMRDALVLAELGHRLAQRAVEALALAVVQRAVLKDGVVLEARDIRVRERRTQRFVLRAVAAGLDDQHRAVGSGEVTHIGEPIGQGLIAKDDALVLAL